MIFGSLRARLIGLLVGTVFLTATLSGVFSIFALRADMINKFDNKILQEIEKELSVLSTDLLFTATTTDEFADLPDELAIKNEIIHEGFEYALRISSATGEPIFASQFFEHQQFAPLEQSNLNDFTETKSDQGTPVRFFTVKIINPETNKLYGTLQIGHSTEQIIDAITDQLWVTSLGVLLATLVAVLMGWLTAQKILAPIKKITITAKDLSVKNLKGHIQYRGPPGDELTLLAQTFDQMLNRLGASVANLKRFTSDASHELRTPLTALAATLDVSLASGNPADHKRALREARVEVRRLTRLVEDLLLLARTDSAVLVIQKKPLRLTPFLRTIAENLSPLAAEHRVVITTDELPHDILLEGDADKLYQLFFNLCTNAIKFNHPGGTVRLTIKQSSKRVKINIQDTGQGIRQKERKKIFQRFYQIDSSRTGDSSGLGLAICEKIATAHGGKITVTSKLGKGSTFIVTLPLK